MRQVYLLFLVGGIFFIYGAVNYYIGLRGWQAFSPIFPYKGIYWTFFWLVAASFILARLGERFFPPFNGKYLALIGGYWMAALYYLLIVLLIMEIIVFLSRRLNFPLFQLSPLHLGLVIITVIILLLAYGTYNAQNPKITRYDLTIPKRANNLTKAHVVLLSDIHLGRIVDHDRLKDLVDRVNGLKPDIVIFAGDIVDENVNVLLEEEMAKSFLNLKAPWGSYAVLGNHEYIGGHAKEITSHLEEGGIKVLKDRAVLINNSFYIVGRDDLAGKGLQGSGRKSLSQLVETLDKTLPIIVLDHQPENLNEALEAGADLQLSGHTHKGQFFPNNYITGKIFEIDWGYLKKGNLQVIVSSGYGTWGPPVRIGSHSEIVDIYLTFSGSDDRRE